MKKTFTIKAVSPGQAELHIAPWSEATDDLELSILRNEGEPHLNPQLQQWGGEEHWIRLQGAHLNGDNLVMPLDASVVDPLLAGTQNARCQARLRVAGNTLPAHALRIDRDVLPSTAAGHAPGVGGSSQINAPVTTPSITPPVEDAAPVADDHIDVQPTIPAVAHASAPAVKKKPVALWVALLFALLLAIGAGVYFFFVRPAPPSSTNNVPSAAAPATASALVCSADNLTGTDALSFVQSCIRDVHDSSTLLTVIQAARNAGQCEIAQRLYANRANAGDTLIALAYAQEYDPASHQDNACFEAETATARYWYESVLEREPENTQAKQRLQALPQ